MVEENVGESIECEEILGCGVEGLGKGEERVVGGGEHRKGTFTREGFSEAGSSDSCFEQVVDVAVDDDIDHGGGSGIVFHNDGADHPFILGIVAYPVFVMIDTGFVKGDGPHAVAEEEEGVIGRETEWHRVVEIIAGVTRLSIDAVPTSVIGEGHAFTHFNGQLSGVEFVIVYCDMVVAIALGHGCG